MQFIPYLFDESKYVAGLGGTYRVYDHRQNPIAKVGERELAEAKSRDLLRKDRKGRYVLDRRAIRRMNRGHWLSKRYREFIRTGSIGIITRDIREVNAPAPNNEQLNLFTQSPSTMSHIPQKRTILTKEAGEAILTIFDLKLDLMRFLRKGEKTIKSYVRDQELTLTCPDVVTIIAGHTGLKPEQITQQSLN